MTRREPEKWHEVPGVRGILVAGGALVVILAYATVFGAW
ncbi:hypothetical protein QDA02_gp28 [Microbacterium phage Margaery]|uniref:Uncharacterized protein n=1 Tax=Microbacterium phage Margaery TaxID=2591217 RepID=A0A514DHR4_9CAUD|nr:hypothetical protein QDA02_gp28 [Microbacterium phage Margaery]QDH93137.1 hypothetical protein PBI_MARGAERY_80 [Microbacterium phage Margaery]